MVPALLNPAIIGLLWIRKDNIIIKLTTETLIINSHGLKFLIKEIPILLEIRELTVTPFTILIKRAKKCQKPVIIFKVLLKNITKVLQFNIIKTQIEIRKLLSV